MSEKSDKYPSQFVQGDVFKCLVLSRVVPTLMPVSEMLPKQSEMLEALSASTQVYSTIRFHVIYL